MSENSWMREMEWIREDKKSWMECREEMNEKVLEGSLSGKNWSWLEDEKNNKDKLWEYFISMVMDCNFEGFSEEEKIGLESLGCDIELSMRLMDK